MSFELIIQTDYEGKETEMLEETTTKVQPDLVTVKHWDSSQLTDRIAKLAAEIETLQERKTLLESQLSKFTVKEIAKE